MKSHAYLLCLLVSGIGLFTNPLTYAAIVLPSGASYPTNSASNSGFVVRSAQASTNVLVVNSFTRALRQIDGTLLDSANNLVTNMAIPGTNANSAYYLETRVGSRADEAGRGQWSGGNRIHSQRRSFSHSVVNG